MKCLSDLLCIGYFFIFIKLINSYLLIAANLNDLRTIAKKLVPENFADKLATMVSDQDFVKSETNYDGYEESDTSGNSRPHLKGQEDVPKKNYEIQDTKIDFEELVERVKKRLEEELKNKYLKHETQNEKLTEKSRDEVMQSDNTMVKNKVDNSFKKVTSEQPTARSIEEAVYEDIDYDEAITEKQKQAYSVKETKLTTQDIGYADAMAEDDSEKAKLDTSEEPIEKKRPNNDYESVTQNDMYHKVNLMKKDSYEDYELPKKGNVFVSQETTAHEGPKRFKIQKNRQNTVRVKYIKKYTSKEAENLSNENNDTIILTDFKERPKKTRKGTMIPKRQFYTIVTPNYVDKIPNVAEKYNFDEPLPARDREREEIRYFGNPLASINNKVKVE